MAFPKPPCGRTYGFRGLEHFEPAKETPMSQTPPPRRTPEEQLRHLLLNAGIRLVGDLKTYADAVKGPHGDQSEEPQTAALIMQYIERLCGGPLVYPLDEHSISVKTMLANLLAAASVGRLTKAFSESTRREPTATVELAGHVLASHVAPDGIQTITEFKPTHASLVLSGRNCMCCCATHCANTCEPAHCPPGTPPCDCFCHEKERREKTGPYASRPRVS